MSLSKATNVAEEINNIDTTEKKTNDRISAKKKNVPNSKILNLIKEQQQARRDAELKADEEAKENQRLQEESERKQQEEFVLLEKKREKKREAKKKRIQRQKQEGLYLTKEQREKHHRAQIQFESIGIHVPPRTNAQQSDIQKRILYNDFQKTNLSSITTPSTEDEDSWDENSDEENICNEDSVQTKDILRAPVICVLGHVDAGKTTILDNLRRTHVQDNEAGGITQQMGATNVPLDTIVERTKMSRKLISRQGDFMIPGLLIIDTPGHAIFQNLRSRGSSLCDLAILVVDIMNGLQAQTIESIRLLIDRQTPFIIALNKIDLLYGWKSNKEKDVESVLEEQDSFTQNHFEKRYDEIIVQFAKQGLNVALYYKNPNPNEYYSMVPTSARSGDGMGSLIAMIIETSQTNLAKHISYTNELQATVMEVKAIHGLGTTIDVALINGCLSVGDKIIVGGQEGPIVTQIRRLLIPESNQELRDTNQYENKDKVMGTCVVKIAARDLEKSLAGLPLFIARNHDEIDYFKNEIELILTTVLNSFKLKDNGVYIQASTLGSLEAFLELLKIQKIPCSGVNIGPVHRKDVLRASTQLENDIKWATILAFDVKIEKDAQDYAKTMGVKIFQNDEIYNLCSMFVAYQNQLIKENQDKYRHLAVFPCKLKILPQNIFNSRDPIICGVRIEDGFIKIGTPICVLSKDMCIDLGRIASIEMNHKSLDIARKGSEVCIKIVSTTNETAKMYGRHFDKDDILMSKISRESIDIVKAYFRDEMQESDWRLIIELKKIFNIV